MWVPTLKKHACRWRALEPFNLRVFGERQDELDDLRPFLAEEVVGTFGFGWHRRLPLLWRLRRLRRLPPLWRLHRFHSHQLVTEGRAVRKTAMYRSLEPNAPCAR